MEEYKQKISNINYNDNTINISLNRSEWNSTDTWIQSMEMKGCERLGKEWFEDLHYKIMRPITNEINFSNKNYSYNENITFKIPRQLLKMFVFSIGQIAYNFDVKGITAITAKNILNKIEKQLIEQLPSDSTWFTYGY